MVMNYISFKESCQVDSFELMSFDRQIYIYWPKMTAPFRHCVIYFLSHPVFCSTELNHCGPLCFMRKGFIILGYTDSYNKDYRGKLYGFLSHC